MTLNVVVLKAPSKRELTDSLSKRQVVELCQYGPTHMNSINGNY